MNEVIPYFDDFHENATAITEIDPIVSEFICREAVKDAKFLPMSNTRRICRKIYRICKCCALGVPVSYFIIKDIATEICYAGGPYMTKKIAWTPIIALVPAPIISCGLAVYKTARSPFFRKTAAFVTNAVGLIYTIPAWTVDHSILYAFECAAFGSPVPIFPESRLRIIPNETSDSELGEIILDAMKRYVESEQLGDG